MTLQWVARHFVLEPVKYNNQYSGAGMGAPAVSGSSPGSMTTIILN